MRDPILQEALKVRGTISRIAAAAGVTPSAVSQWQKVPAERVLSVAEITGLAPHELRPDVFPAPQPADACS
jgi:DNA-binding transcriptional regulator YdaS (Cro superfamily)